MLALFSGVLAFLSGIYRDNEDRVNCSLPGKHGDIEVQVNWLKRKCDIKTKQTTEAMSYQFGMCLA